MLVAWGLVGTVVQRDRGVTRRTQGRDCGSLAHLSRLRICLAIIGLSATAPQSQQFASGISDVSYPEGSATLLGDASMKKLLTVLVALGVAVSFMTPTFAAPPKTKAECEKAHMKWDAATKACS